MKRNRLYNLLLSMLLVACQPSPPEQDSTALEQVSSVVQEATNQIVIGQIDSIESSILQEERDLWVYLPASAMDDFADRSYPVVYLLDGNGHFHSVSGMIRQLSTINGNKKVPEMMVVGIPNTDRFRDLTPTHTEGTSGGGTAFLDFVENEVIPYVEDNYPASQYRTFVGHSLGGLMAIEALITRPEVFDNYVAIDPSLWWDEQSTLHRAEAALNERDFSAKTLYISAANTMPRDMTLEEVLTDDQERTRHMRSILQLSRSAEANTSSGLNFAWNYYGDDTHGSVPLISEYDAFRFMFPWYDPMPAISVHFDPESEDSADEVLSVVNAHFDDISDRFGYRYRPSDRFLTQLADIFQFNEKPRSALAMLQFNLQLYPDNPRPHEAMGDYHVSLEEEDAARMHFQHAMERGLEIDVVAKLRRDEADE